MHSTSDLYKTLFEAYQAGTAGVVAQCKLLVGDIVLDQHTLISVVTVQRVFSTNTPSVGDCVAGEITLETLLPQESIPRQARMQMFVRLTDGTRYSEWIPKGVYYIDTREAVAGQSVQRLRVHGYDAMLKTEQPYPTSSLAWPATDLQVVQEIADYIGVSIDARTLNLLNKQHNVQYPANYTCRETLGYIAAMYGGSFVMSDIGELRLITLAGIPRETRYLIESNGQAITFGGVRILV